MKHGNIRNLNRPVPRVVLGTMIVSSDEQDRSEALLDAAFETGLRALDTAHVYAGGKSEQGIGAWLHKRGCRDDVTILSKGCHPDEAGPRVTPEALETDLAISLERLQVDTIDIYMLHRDDPDQPVGPLVEAFNTCLREGKIRAFGASNWTHARIQAANEYAEQNGLVPFAASSPNYGLAEQLENPWGPGCVTISGPQNEAARVWYRKRDMPVFAYSSLGRGLFSGRMTRENHEQLADNACRKAYCHEVNFERLDRARELAAKKRCSVPQLALAFVLNQDLNVFALTGAASREECEANAAAADIELTPAELAWLDRGAV